MSDPTGSGTALSTSVSTHILDTSRGRPASGVGVRLSVSRGGEQTAEWAAHGASRTDADGRCKDLPALPEGTARVRLEYETEPYFTQQQDAAIGDSAPRSFFPEVSVVFTVNPGEHYHVPLLLNPFGYSVYRGS
jgi:hydroxyisourate hydrolase